MTLYEKEAWMACAESDKVQYIQDLSKYMPPPDYVGKLVLQVHDRKIHDETIHSKARKEEVI